ncbi:uncharacterized protein [Periplaneta americana]|uniref:uncharacterized protein isoform X2 n=1 Tax=Periplaneta americana TaxID=6978 RepID=UPI0037E905F0
MAHTHKETLARLHAQFAALSRLKYVVGKTNGEPPRRNAGESSVSQSAKTPNSDCGGPSSQPDTAEGESGESSDKGSPCKRKRAEDTEAGSSGSGNSWLPPYSSHQQRLIRYSRRVHLRRPRLLALGSRPKLGCGNSSPRSIFRQHIRPWAATQVTSNEGGGSTGSGTSNGSCEQMNSDPTVSSSEVSVSDQSSSPSDEVSQQSGNNTSSHGEAQPGPSRTNRGEDTVPHGMKRKAEAGTSTVCPSTSTRHEPTTSESLRAMIARLETLVRQQREQQEAARREASHDRGGRRTNMWGLRGDVNSGSDSDSNPESERQQAWRRTPVDERLMTSTDGEAGSGPRHGREDWEWTRESTRLRARQVLSLMVESLTQFFEENGLSNNTSHAVLDEQIYNLYVLLQLALELTDLLLAQLLSTRRELEHQWVHRLRSPVALDASATAGQRRGRGRDPLDEEDARDAQRLGHAYATYRRLLRYHHLGESDPMDYLVNRGESGRRLGPRMMNYYSRHGHGAHRREEPHIAVRVQNTPPPPPPQPPAQDTFTVPLVRVNDVLIPDTSLLSQPQPLQRPQSPPPHPRNPFISQQQPQSPIRYLSSSVPDTWRTGWRPRFLHPRYMAPNPFSDDQEEPFIGPALENINFIRDSFIITDAPMSPNHRIQAWDFSKLSIPDISNEKNVIVAECKIHNDASVDVSSDGRLLVTLLPTGRLSSTAMLGVYSLEWESLGQCLYTTSFEQNAVSVSLSPASRHLLVGLASRRVALLPTDRHTMAQIFRLEGGVPGRAIGARGRLCHIRDIEQDREQGYMSLNCIRWAPGPGQGLVYGTNTGKLKVLR